MRSTDVLAFVFQALSISVRRPRQRFVSTSLYTSLSEPRFLSYLTPRSRSPCFLPVLLLLLLLQRSLPFFTFSSSLSPSLLLSYLSPPPPLLFSSSLSYLYLSAASLTSSLPLSPLHLLSFLYSCFIFHSSSSLSLPSLIFHDLHSLVTWFIFNFCFFIHIYRHLSLSLSHHLSFPLCLTFLLFFFTFSTLPHLSSSLPLHVSLTSPYPPLASSVLFLHIPLSLLLFFYIPLPLFIPLPHPSPTSLLPHLPLHSRLSICLSPLSLFLTVPHNNLLQDFLTKISSSSSSPSGIVLVAITMVSTPARACSC